VGTVRVRCIGCHGDVLAQGVRLHRATLVRCPTCGREYALSDDSILAERPDAAFVDGAWRSSEGRDTEDRS
jgi:hypothetical protein